MVEAHLILPNTAPSKGGPKMFGNKAWNLMLMAQAGLPVPSGFVLPTSWCQRAERPLLTETLDAGITALEAAPGLGFGATRRPLLVSVRSGAAVSMPGMMETVLDVGLNLETVQGMIRLTGNPRLAWDSYRRLARAKAETEQELDHRDLRALTIAMLDCYRTLTGRVFPADPHEQLADAAAAVFRSWFAAKAASYRKLNGISDEAGTAVTVQTMVYGNAGRLS